MEQTPPPFSVVHKYLPVLEKFFLLTLAIGLLFSYLKMGFPQVTFIALGGLGVVFFLSAYRPLDVPKEEGKLMGFQELLAYVLLPKILWISSAVLTIGLLFHSMGNPGSSTMLGIGSTIVIVGSLILLVFAFTGTKHLSLVIPVLYRAIPALVVGGYIYFRTMQ